MRPSDHALHDHQTSNSTANAFLGGRRMPSWLTSGQPQTNATPLVPSRKRPPPKDLDPPVRSSKAATKRPSSSASPNLPCAASHASAHGVAAQNASNPASPSLPNVVAPQTSQSSSNENNILPSPAPSEDLSANRGTAATVVSLGDEDEDEEDHNADNGRAEGTEPTQRRSISLAGPDASRRDSLPVAGPPTVKQVNGTADVPRVERRPHPAASGCGSPQNAANGATVHSSRNAAEPWRDLRRWRNLPPPGTSCFAPPFLNLQLQLLSGGGGLSGVECIRAELVHEAVSTGDHDYLRFHQLMCLKELSADRLPPEFTSVGDALSALDTLNELVETTGASTAWLQWFADFPVPIRVLKQRWPEEYGRYILHFRQFMSLSTGGWQKLQMACCERKLPPTAVEIRKELGVGSPLWQSIFNRAAFRRLCGFPNPYSPQQVKLLSDAEAAFKDHQMRLQKLRTISPTAQQLSIDEMNEEKRYRDTIIRLQRVYFSQFQRPDQLTIQARMMFLQAPLSQGQQSNSPVNQTHPNSPAQHSPSVMSAQQQTMSAHQSVQPQGQRALPRTPGVPQPAQFGAMTPTSTLPSSHIATVQNMNRMVYDQNQQQVQQPVQVSSPVMGPPNVFATNGISHSPTTQNWTQGHPQPPMSPEMPSPGTQQFHAQPVYQGMPNGANHPQMYQRRQSGPIQPHYNQGQTHQQMYQRRQSGPSQPHDNQGMLNGANHQQMYQRRQSGPIQPHDNHGQIHHQQVLRSNSTPSLAAAQSPRPLASQMNPRQTNRPMGSPVHPDQPQGQPFVPRSGFIWQPQVIDSSRSALHQAHLRSPALQAIEGSDVGRKLYQAVVDFALPPTRLADQQAQQNFSFTVSAEDKVRLPTEIAVGLGKPCKRLVAEGSKLYRLRCARSKSTEEHEWVLQDTFWPGGMFLNLNGEVLETRKKLQHGKDLPIDITKHLRPGDNQLEINLLRRPNEERASNFVISVDVVGVEHYDRIKADCSSNRIIPAEEVLNSIKSSLNGPGDDDEVAIVDSNVTINLFDPFTNCRPCEVPVRGRYCLHRNCFDLELFLQTRDRKQPDSPSLADVWRCPICRGDVRPKNLMVDGFMLEVHKELSMMGQLDTRAIIVGSDGKWKPKPEEKNDDARASHSSAPGDNKKALASSTSETHQPVIELD